MRQRLRRATLLSERNRNINDASKPASQDSLVRYKANRRLIIMQFKRNQEDIDILEGYSDLEIQD